MKHLILLMLVCVAASAQTRMTVIGPDNDSVGQAFIADLTEAIKHSTKYQYVELGSDGSCKCFTVVVQSVSDTTCGAKNSYASAVSVVLLFSVPDNSVNGFLGQWVLIVGRERTALAAREQLAAIDTRLAMALKISEGRKREETK